MLFHRKHSETVRIVVKAVRPGDSAEFIIHMKFTECLRVAKNNAEIIGTIIAETNACAVPILEGQQHNERQVLINCCHDDALWSPSSGNLKFFSGIPCIHILLLFITDTVGRCRCSARCQFSASSSRCRRAHSVTRRREIFGKTPLSNVPSETRNFASYSPYRAWKCDGG